MTNPSAFVKEGTVEAIFYAKQSDPLYHEPWLQIISLRKMGTDSTTDRYRYFILMASIVLSDGRHCIPGMLMSQLKSFVENGTLGVNYVMKLKSFVCTLIKGRKILVVRDISPDEVFPYEQKIGEPSALGLTSPTEEQTNPVETAPAKPAMPDFSVPPVVKPQPVPEPVKQVPVQRQPQPQHQTKSDSNERITLLEHISPYQSDWTVKVRVTSKSDIRKFTSRNDKAGQLFSVCLVDQSSEIKCVAFGDAVTKFHPIFEQGKAYIISNGVVKVANKKFNGNIQHDYEIHLNTNSVVTPCFEDTSALPSVRYNFVPIRQIAQYEKDQYIDVIGVVQNCGELSSITVKSTQTSLSKRDVTLLDTSMYSVKVTLWGIQAEQANYTDNPVLAIKSARVSDFNGKGLSTVNNSVITTNPDIPESFELCGWYSTNGSNLQITPLSAMSGAVSNVGMTDVRKFVSQIKSEQLGLSEKADYYSMLASIVYMKTDGNISYPACPSEGCNKKVTSEGPNQYRCEKCQKVYDTCDHRYIFSMNVGDFSGQEWLSVFNEAGAVVFGRPASEMVELKENDDEQYKKIISDLVFKDFLFKVRSKQESYNNESRVKNTVVSVSSVDYVQESQGLLQLIDKYIS